MSTTIKHIRSSVSGRTPTTSQLPLGVLAINTADGKVFIKKDVSGTETIVDIGTQTAAEILTAIKTVDGTGSGLDADKVDGLQATSFLRSDALDIASEPIRFSKGSQNGFLQGYNDYELLLDFESDAAGSDRRIVSIASPNVVYSTIGFTIEIIDNDANHAPSNTINTVSKETYYVNCVRSDGTTLNSPDQIYVNGPGSKIQGVKVSQGNYEILLRNHCLWCEYRVSIKVHAVNGSHTVNYHNGDTPSSGTISAPTASQESLEKFQGVNFINANASGPIFWDSGTLSTFDPPGSAGSDTRTDAAIALGTGHAIVGHNDGYIRSLFEWNNTSDITIGQGNTGLIGGIALRPGSAGSVKAFHANTEIFKTTSTGLEVTGTATATAFVGDGSGLTNLPGGGPILFNQITISSNVTFASGYNGLSVGPVAVANGVTVEVTANSTWQVLT